LTRAGIASALLGLLACGCGLPAYTDVGLQVDLQVTEHDDPFDAIAGVRICLSADVGDAFYLFPRDPGSYLITGIPGDTDYDLVVQGLDAEPDDIEPGASPRVLAHAAIDAAPVAIAGEPAFVEAAFTSCGDDCPADCSAPATLPAGDQAIGLRRMLAEP